MKQNTDRSTCLVVACAYFVSGIVWILYADTIFAVVLARPELAEKLSSPSQWFFIALSTGMLYWLLRYWNTAVAESQESLRKVNRSLRSFSECTKAMTRTDDELQLMQGICRICVEVGGHRMAWIASGENNAEKDLRSLTYWGAKGCFLETLKASWEDNEIGQGPAGTSIRTGQITVFQNLKTDPRYRPWRDAAEKCEYGSCIALPLIDDQEVYGSLVIFDQKPDAFDTEESKLLEELADDLTYGIRSLRLKAKSKREVEERLMLATVMDQTSDGVITFDSLSRIQYVNPSFESLCGVPAQEAIGLSIHDFECSKRNRKFYQAILNVFESKKIGGGHFINKNRDGTEYDIDARISPVFGDNGKVVRYVATIRDVTQEVGLQRQLRQAQKMEALATLSGGIAHDFNNILAIIITNAEMILEDMDDDDLSKNSIELVLKAGLRGKTLVKQFLTISRQDEQPVKPVKIKAVVDECLNLLRSTLPSTIEINKEIRKGLGLIAADATQIHQVIMNLCTNAADAMREQGGIINVSMKDRLIKEHELTNYPGLSSGAYVELVVADTGHGMSREVLDRIFDPFFTTKGHGRGTGLGLSIAHGIIKNHGGYIDVTSTENVGTTFSVLLPQIDGQLSIQNDSSEQNSVKGQGQILFVDDEEDYVAGMKIALERLGYEVTGLTDSRKTLETFRSDPMRYDLLITDQTMPQMTGVMLAKEVLKIRPELPVILCSGSSPETDGAVNEGNAQAAGIRKVLMKPVERQELHQQIQELLK
ncbi:MAG: hybrid sensor histidine kinase/response regulator [Desulfuromonas sp.]|nr:MAG: hybrid sensor histidine kinase/response regulator [Desulfuromonas sp.]